MAIKKWLPCSMWDFMGLQNWINEQAAAGYALMEWPGVWDIGRISFAEDPTACNARYRLEPIDDRIGEQERNEIHAQSGWTFISKIHRLYAVYRCDDPKAPELYADPESLSPMFKKLVKRQWIEMILTFIWAGWVLWDEIVNLFAAPALLPLQLILSTEILLPLYLALFVCVAAQLIRTVYRLVKLRRLRRQLTLGVIPAAGKRHYQELWDNLSAVIAFICAVYLVFLLISGDMHTQYLESQKEWDFPHVTLEELVSKDTALRVFNDQELLFSDKFKHSAFAPEQYETAQGAAVSLPNSTQREYRLYIDYFRTKSPAVAELVFLGKIAERQRELEEYRKNWEEYSPSLHNKYPNAYDYVRQETVEHSVLDELYAFTYQFSDQKHPNVHYVGRYGEQVFTMMCSGGLDGEAALVLLTERLAAD